MIKVKPLNQISQPLDTSHFFKGTLMGRFTIDELIEIHKMDCSMLKYGKCDSRPCLIYGGWKPGIKPADIKPTCEAYETVEILCRAKEAAEAPPQEQEVESRSTTALRILGIDQTGK